MSKIKTPIAILALLGLLLISPLRAQQDVDIKAIQLSQQIFMLTGQGGNIGLFIGEDGSFVIDDQFAPLTEKILAAIRSAGGDRPRFVINTHFHGDHTGGNENLGKSGSLLVSHDKVRERLLNGSFIEAFGMKSPPASKAALPLLTYSSDMHFHINGESVQAIHVADAHTDGDSIIHFKSSNIVHAGDVFFNGFYPFIDVAHGGSLSGTIKAADVILSITDDNSKIIPGHGPLATRADLEKYRNMLNTAYTRLLKLKNSGQNLEQAIAANPLADLESSWGGGIFKGDKWISIVYAGVY